MKDKSAVKYYYYKAIICDIESIKLTDDDVRFKESVQRILNICKNIDMCCSCDSGEQKQLDYIIAELNKAFFYSENGNE